MNILIADKIGVYRFGFKTIIGELWTDAVVSEACNFDKAIELVFDNNFDLLVLDIELAPQELLANFIGKAIRHTKVVMLLGDCLNEEASSLSKIGADAIIFRSTSKEEVSDILKWMFS
ncbi:hypothetical protein VRU48_07110 [Pedobacter sp. KR3-3]|uniref:Response regulatory domain-containing protein n=1 Tax=Pedobacter albus TaxID=3113905 RepID=A0ABU7I5X3_9SPHI|nr:hypothetical protein [Pedobacter sp. KR3-3]MEE1944867.1 hypothetical protein [Pedobacter sp. KR3-3]